MITSGGEGIIRHAYAGMDSTNARARRENNIDFIKAYLSIRAFQKNLHPKFAGSFGH
jgi:hypothetical protein